MHFNKEEASYDTGIEEIDNGISDLAARVTDNVLDFVTGNDAFGDSASEFVRSGINRLGRFLGNLGK